MIGAGAPSPPLDMEDFYRSYMQDKNFTDDMLWDWALGEQDGLRRTAHGKNWRNGGG